MGRDPFGIFKEGEVHTISYRCLQCCRSGLLTAMPYSNNRAEGRRSYRCYQQVQERYFMPVLWVLTAIQLKLLASPSGIPEHRLEERLHLRPGVGIRLRIVGER